MQDTKLLQYIHETAQMGVEGLKNVIGQIHDDKLGESIESQIKEYREISEEAAKLLRSKGQDPKPPSLLARISSEFMSTVQTMADSSSSNIAEMVIQGNNMGITKSLKHLHDYAGDNRQVHSLAKRLLTTEQSNVEQMKPFL